MLNELDPVVLTRDLPGASLATGDIGTVVHRYADDQYEVEFVAGSGRTVAVVTLAGPDVRTVGPEEILHARQIAS